MSDKERMHAAYMAMVKTGPQHESLARFAGTWRAEAKFWMDPAAPPQVSTGTMTCTLVLGGRFLQQEYRGDGGMFEGRGFWGYNTIDQRYEGLWIDSMATFFQVEHGQHDPATDTYAMHGAITDPMSRKTIKKRSVITYKGPDEHTVEMFFEGQAGRENKTMEIRYKRA